ncbi:MAG: hypothetical protein ACI8VC_001607 [Candidatus Endobugula sp.]|jgi:hypothetical protein
MIKTTIEQEINVGIDSSQSRLDIYIRPLDIYLTVSNDDEGVKEAIKKLQAYPPTRVIIEATERLEMLLFVMHAPQVHPSWQRIRHKPETLLRPPVESLKQIHWMHKTLFILVRRWQSSNLHTFK